MVACVVSADIFGFCSCNGCGKRRDGTSTFGALEFYLWSEEEKGKRRDLV